MNRTEAVKIVGEEAVEDVELKSCDFTSRLLDEADDTVEFKASIECFDIKKNPIVLSIYYNPTQNEVNEAGGDLGAIDWENCVGEYEVM